jgi:hypothetical protein
MTEGGNVAASTAGRAGLIRTAGFGALAIAAVLITFLGAPEAPKPTDTSTFDRQIEVALADYEANNARTQGAPQQEVVNGWVTKDLLTVLTEQTNAMLATSQSSAADPRIPLLLMLFVLAACLHALTAPATRARTEGAPDAGAGFDKAPPPSGPLPEAVEAQPTTGGSASQPGAASVDEHVTPPPTS